MNPIIVTTTIVTALAISVIGIITGSELILADRVAPGLKAGPVNLSVVPLDNVENLLKDFEQSIVTKSVTLQLRDHSVTHPLADLGVKLNQAAAVKAVQNKTIIDTFTNNNSIQPTAYIDKSALSSILQRDFTAIVTEPKNASLTLSTKGNFSLEPSQPGEVIDLKQLTSDLEKIVNQQQWGSTIQLSVREAQPEVLNNEVSQAQQFAELLLTNGLDLVFNDQIFTMKPYTIRRLIGFAPQVDTQNHQNMVLGITFDNTRLTEYLDQTISPDINQEAQNARFELKEDRVEQFAMPLEGQQLDIARTSSHIASKLAKRERTVPLAIDVTKPDITELANIEQIGITSLLATGESDYVGSPKNRVHNINIGASRYHGLLLPTGSEFSFNQFLGPVSSKAGYKPELVIKHNVTTPELGGGLCQVSTTMFRAALNSGLEITQRRNHAYPVSYYGKPGLDATIYPPYTDLRFLNNTPGYILIQSRIEGTKLVFEFWGTDDGRQVELAGPTTYDYQPDGAVKAYVEQKVTLDDATIIEDTFYSRYKSPKLFPRVLAANGEAPPNQTEVALNGTPTPSPTNEPAKPQSKETKPKPTTQPAKSPAASPKSEASTEVGKVSTAPSPQPPAD